MIQGGVFFGVQFFQEMKLFLQRRILCSNVGRPTGFHTLQMACWSLKNVLTQLAEIYPDMEGKRHRELDLPLEVSLPIRVSILFADAFIYTSNLSVLL